MNEQSCKSQQAETVCWVRIVKENTEQALAIVGERDLVRTGIEVVAAGAAGREREAAGEGEAIGEGEATGEEVGTAEASGELERVEGGEGQ
jgi:hypothetical protein